jgi:Ca-activated chloride channel homolog
MTVTGKPVLLMLTALLVNVLVGTPIDAQDIVGQHHTRPGIASHVIIPQTRSFTHERHGTVIITKVDVGIVILEQVATTTMDIHLRNPTNRRLEAEMVVPVPDDAVVRGFDFQGTGKEPSAELLPKDEARRIYDSIVSKMRDPALLEFIDYNLIRSSVFPVEPNQTQKIRLTYETILNADGNRVDYVLPRSDSLNYTVPWDISLTIKSNRPISTVYSPSHPLETAISSNNNVCKVKVSDSAKTMPGSFRFSYLLEGKEGVTASLMAYPDGTSGGYFLLLAGLPGESDLIDAKKIKREVTLVLDRSGSMNGEKLEQVREGAKQIISGLEDGEAFNIIVYNEVVESFADQPVIKSSQTEQSAHAFLDSMKARGGTNIHDALLESLRQKPSENMLPMVLFLTDGRPTIGETSEKAIRALAKAANPYNRRIFTFGVGVDVNSPLLENVAYQSRAASTFVLPNEDVELKIAGVFKRLSGPILADPELKLISSDGSVAIGRLSDLMPVDLPDMFEGDQLVLLGRYVGEKPVTFKLSGNYLGERRSFDFRFGFEKATTKNAFIPRLWAGRKIGVLIDAIRSSGADSSTAMNDPRLKELVDEIIRLSTEFGILTEYTSFLAREGSDLSLPDAVRDEAMKNFRERGIETRTGAASINQEFNNTYQKGQSVENKRNEYWDENLNRVDISAVQQVGDRAFFRKSDMWIDSRLVNKTQSEQTPDKTVEFGSPEFMKYARELATSGRQGSIAFHQDTIMLIGDERVLFKAPKPVNE